MRNSLSKPTTQETKSLDESPALETPPVEVEKDLTNLDTSLARTKSKNVAKNFQYALRKISYVSQVLAKRIIEGKPDSRPSSVKTAFQHEVARVDTAKKTAKDFHSEACPDLAKKRTQATLFVGLEKALLPVTIGMFLTTTAPASTLWFGAMIGLILITPRIEAFRNNYANRMGEVSFFGERAALVSRYHDFTFRELSNTEVIDELEAARSQGNRTREFTDASYELLSGKITTVGCLIAIGMVSIPVAVLVSASLIPLLRIEDRKAKFAENVRTKSVRYHKKLWPSFFDLSDVKIVDQVKTMLKSSWATDRVKNLSDNVMGLYTRLHKGILKSDLKAWSINAGVTLASSAYILWQQNIGLISPGSAVQFVFAAVNLQMAIVSITKFRGAQSQSAPYVNRSFNLNKIWRKFHPLQQTQDEHTIKEFQKRLATEPFEVRMKNVKVTQGDSCILKIDDLTLKSDEYIGLVGLRGAGKTTLIRTLLGIIEPDEGEVKITSGDMTFSLKELPLEPWHSVIGWSPQDGYDGRTLKIIDRLLLGASGDIAREKIDHVMHVTGANEFLDYDDLETLTIGQHIEKEKKKNRVLSGGEQATVTNMSALVGDRRVLILDEPTARLDIENAKKLDRELEVSRREKLQIVITHRLSALSNTDRIIVLENGEIESIGTHQELKSRSDGLYQRLLSQQETQPEEN